MSLQAPKQPLSAAAAATNYRYRDYGGARATAYRGDGYSSRKGYDYSRYSPPTSDRLADRAGYDDYGIDRSGGYSGYGHEKKCCPLVIKPLVFLSLLAGIAAGTAFLNVLITMNVMRRRRKRREIGPGVDAESKVTVKELLYQTFHQGEWQSWIFHGMTCSR